MYTHIHTYTYTYIHTYTYFKHKNGATGYTHIKVCRNKSYFTSDPLNGDNNTLPMISVK